MGACLQSQAGEVHRKAQRAEHQIGALRCVGNHVEPRPERADEDADENRSARQSEFDGYRNPGYRNRNASERQTQNQTDEYGRQIGLVEAFHGVAEDFLDAADVFGLAHDGQPVAQLEQQGRELPATVRPNGKRG